MLPISASSGQSTTGSGYFDQSGVSPSGLLSRSSSGELDSDSNSGSGSGNRSLYSMNSSGMLSRFSTPCSPDAACTNLPGSFVCRCRNEFKGDGFDCQRKLLVHCLHSVQVKLCQIKLSR